jgi:hypothetical protein
MSKSKAIKRLRLTPALAKVGIAASGRGPEVYRFTWHISFDGDAVVRIGRQGGEITLRWTDRWYTLCGDERPFVALTLAGPARVQAALIAMSFWSLDAEKRRLGLNDPTG